jgi:hypothetical protein
MSKLRRTMLFMPGNNPGMLINAPILGSDSVILDLEDAVSLTEKDSARVLVREAIKNIDYKKRTLNTDYKARTANTDFISRTKNTDYAAMAAKHNYSAIGKVISKALSKPVIGTRTQDGKNEYFSSQTEAAKFVDGFVPNISACCRGKAKSAYGYFWSFCEAANYG